MVFFSPWDIHGHPFGRVLSHLSLTLPLATPPSFAMGPKTPPTRFRRQLPSTILDWPGQIRDPVELTQFLHRCIFLKKIGFSNSGCDDGFPSTCMGKDFGHFKFSTAAMEYERQIELQVTHVFFYDTVVTKLIA